MSKASPAHCITASYAAPQETAIPSAVSWRGSSKKQKNSFETNKLHNRKAELHLLIALRPLMPRPRKQQSLPLFPGVAQPKTKKVFRNH
jgi:hypothetical protein